MVTVMTFNNVSKKYKEKSVLKDICFTVKSREIIGLVGANGAGKTTLMRILVGLTKQYEGEIHSEFLKPQIGCVIESPNFYPYLSGYQNLLHFSKYTTSDKSEVIELLDMLGLMDAAHKKVKTYSLGMRQRLGIAQALLGQPDILVLDEPTNGLDPQGVQSMRQYLKRIVKTRNVGILLSSHILSEIEKICDRVMLLKDGILTENIRTLVSEQAHNVAYQFKTPEPTELTNFLQRKHFKVKRFGQVVEVQLPKEKIFSTIRAITQENLYFESVTAKEADLEEQFMQIVGGDKS